jgi:hypothetical protein
VIGGPVPGHHDLPDRTPGVWDLHTSAGTDPTSARWVWVRYGAFPLAVWLLYWLAFFPGMVEYDGLDQWRQIVEGRYNDWHPAFHTWIMWLLTRPGRSFGSMTLIQLLVAAGLAGALLARARRLGAPAWLIWAAAAWLALSPVFALNLIAVWKDTAFALVLLWMTLLLLRVVEDRALTASLAIQLGTSCALASLIRHNGAAVAIPVVATLAWHFRARARRALALMLIVWLGAVILVRGPLYRAGRVAPGSPILSEESLILEVAALVSAGTPLTEDEKAFLGRFLALDAWRSAYVCDRAARPLLRAGFRRALLVQHPFILVPIGLRLAARNPSALVRHWTCATRFLWSPSSTLYIGYIEDGTTVLPNAQGVTARSLLPGVGRRLAAVVARTFDTDSAWRALVWQPAVPLYLLIASLAVAVWRAGGGRPVLVWLPGLCNTIVWVVFTHGAQLRFQWPVVLLAPFTPALATIDWQSERAADVAPNALPHTSAITPGAAHSV